MPERIKPMDANSKKAVLLLGHGSKAPDANDTLRKVAVAVKKAGGYGEVLPAFLQMEEPDFQEGVGRLVSRGFKEITVMPYFLYPGLHVTQDIPAEIEKALLDHAGLKISFAKWLGFHDKLIDITLERIVEAHPKEISAPALQQHPIEEESFRLIGTELDESRMPPLELPIVKRVIHTTADFEFKEILCFSKGAIEAGIDAIRAGRPIIADVRMVEAGIMRYRLDPFGVKLYCFSSDKDVEAMAKEENITKTAASMRKATRLLEGSIVAIGNAPTALFELLRLIKAGASRPALVIGVPVGFVGAAEAKGELVKSGINHIATIGRKGGSTVAVAIVNALAIEASQVAVK
ncbi:MAG: precorrin-8X methylmutase [Deltaproteobacteria bacterium]|nr:precorrin-8X methylmutase [Deltaproteobacteria bacterium]